MALPLGGLGPTVSENFTCSREGKDLVTKTYVYKLKATTQRVSVARRNRLRERAARALAIAMTCQRAERS